MKKQITIILALVLCVSILAACGGNPENEKVAGTWKATSAEVAGKTLTMDELAKMPGGSSLDMSFEFKSNGTATSSSAGKILGSSKFKVEGDNVIVTDPNGITATFVLSGDTLIWEIQGIKLMFAKK